MTPPCWTAGLILAVTGCQAEIAGAGRDGGPRDAADLAIVDASTTAADSGAVGDGGSAGIDAGALDAGTFGMDDAGPPLPCDFAAPHPPGADVLWPEVLNRTGIDTLGGHGHDDGAGAVGFCAGAAIAGQPFYRLLAAGFESDDDTNGDGDQEDALPVDFWRDEATFVGFGESQGRHHIYVQVVDGAGTVLNRDNAPDIRLRRTSGDGSLDEAYPLDSKPANEFQTNMPMAGGGARYAVAVDGASDHVVNMRMPVNHHVTFVLVFRREMP